jgi:hypothetical protein
MSYSNQQKAQFYEWWIEEGRSYANFKRRVRRENGRRATVPTQNTIKDWQSNFRENGTGQRRPKTKTRFVFKDLNLTFKLLRSVRTPEVIERVRVAFTNNRHLSTRTANIPVNSDDSSDEEVKMVSRTTIQRILKVSAHLKMLLNFVTGRFALPSVQAPIGPRTFAK